MGSRAKNVAIAGGAVGAFLVIILVSYTLNNLALGSLQFRAVSEGEFDLITLSQDAEIAICNPSSFPANFDRVRQTILYKDQEIATNTIKATTINPNDSVTVTSRYVVNRDILPGLLLQGLSAAFAGQTPEFNPDDMSMATAVDVKLIGLIPYSYQKTHTMEELASLPLDDKWTCS